MKGIYLAAFKALHKGYDIVYQDINGKRDLPGDMMDYDLEKYRFVIATPPCNYYSRANYRREVSYYSQITKHLLPDILHKLCTSKVRYWIVENVRNERIFSSLGLFDLPCFVYFIGRHTYWSNVMFFTDVEQHQDFIQLGVYIGGTGGNSCNSREGGKNVHDVIEHWLSWIHDLDK